MKSRRGTLWDLLRFHLALVGGQVFFWLFPLKLLARLGACLGHASPCPAVLWWLLDNPVRRRYMRPVLDRIGIQPGERVLELGPGSGTSTASTQRGAQVPRVGLSPSTCSRR